MNLKQSHDLLLKMISAFDKFDGKPLNEVRTELHRVIKKFESGEYGLAFYRKDNEEIKRVQLWLHKESFDNNMTPDFEIGVDEYKKIWVQNDILWKTIFGIKEQMQEEQAYMYKNSRG